MQEIRTKATIGMFTDTETKIYQAIENRRAYLMTLSLYVSSRTCIQCYTPLETGKLNRNLTG